MARFLMTSFAASAGSLIRKRSTVGRIRETILAREGQPSNKRPPVPGVFSMQTHL
jgi:hypothetical protein